jgi:hypothetical protein
VIEFRTVKTDEELQNALDVEVKNHLYSIAMTGWESPAIPLLLTLDETLPLVAVYANKSTLNGPGSAFAVNLTFGFISLGQYR